MLLGLYLYFEVPEGSWFTIRGTGSIRSWAIDETATVLMIIRNNGVTTLYELKQFEFEEGQFIAEGLLRIGTHELFVAHNQGAYLVNDRGTVKGVFDPAQNGVTKTGPWCIQDLPGKESILVGLGMHPIGFNGKTIICKDMDDYPSLTLLNKRLTWKGNYCFDKEQIISVKPRKATGWTVWVKRGRRKGCFCIQNNGTLTKIH